MILDVRKLQEIEEFTKSNKHLPGVPSAKQVAEKGGILVNRATEINLEKIEELFRAWTDIRTESKQFD